MNRNNETCNPMTEKGTNFITNRNNKTTKKGTHI
jgi:hypothetical protein